VPFDHLNGRFIDLKKAAFSVGQEAENESAIPQRESSLFRLYPNRILGW